MIPGIDLVHPPDRRPFKTGSPFPVGFTTTAPVLCATPDHPDALPQVIFREPAKSLNNLKPITDLNTLNRTLRRHFNRKCDLGIVRLHNVAHHGPRDGIKASIRKDIGVVVIALAARSQFSTHIKKQSGSRCTVVMTPTQTLKDAIPCQGFSKKTGQAAICTEHRGPRITRPRPALVSVTVADHTATVSQSKPVSQHPFKSAPGRVDLHRALQSRIVGVSDIRISATNMGIDHTIFI